ncbi:MAG: PilZ domain-containing protein, partial [Pseudomonadota bacterium]
MALSTPKEDRGAERKRVLKGAKISFAARCASLPCVVRDMSETGARLQVKDHLSVPDTFELIIELDGFEVDVEVVWRKASEVGVIFLDSPKITKATRTQIVGSSVPKSKGTLRRVKPPARRRAEAVARPQSQEEVVAETDIVADDGVSDNSMTSEAFAQTVEHAPLPAEADAEAIDDVGEDVAVIDNAPQHDHPTHLAEEDADVTAEAACDAAVAALADQLTTLEMVAEAPPSTTPDACQSATIEAPTMDYSPSAETPLLASDEAEQLSNTSDASARSEANVQHEQQAVAETAEPMRTHAAAAPVEAPLFRDVAVVIAGAAPTGGLDARISTALQAPTRAAENISRPVVPIIPAPEIAPPAMDSDISSPLLSSPSVETETPADAASVTVEPEASASDTAMERVTATPDAPEPEAADESLPSPSVPLRPELAAFVSAFAPVEAAAVAAVEEPADSMDDNADVALWQEDRERDDHDHDATTTDITEAPETQAALADGQLMSLSDALASPVTFDGEPLDAGAEAAPTASLSAEGRPVRVEFVDEAIVVTPLPASDSEISDVKAAHEAATAASEAPSLESQVIAPPETTPLVS